MLLVEVAWVSCQLASGSVPWLWQGSRVWVQIYTRTDRAMVTCVDAFTDAALLFRRTLSDMFIWLDYVLSQWTVFSLLQYILAVFVCWSVLVVFLQGSTHGLQTGAGVYLMSTFAIFCWSAIFIVFVRIVSSNTLLILFPSLASGIACLVHACAVCKFCNYVIKVLHSQTGNFLFPWAYCHELRYSGVMPGGPPPPPKYFQRWKKYFYVKQHFAQVWDLDYGVSSVYHPLLKTTIWPPFFRWLRSFGWVLFDIRNATHW